MISRGRHPKKEIADALAAAREAGFEVVEIHRGHRWGRLDCPGCGDGHAVYCTPRDPAEHAKRLNEFAERHLPCSQPGKLLRFPFGGRSR